MGTKNANYTPELTAKIVAAYTHEDCNTDEDRAGVLNALSAETGKTVLSLRAKLVREGVYVKKTYVAKEGGKAETKDAIVASIAALMDVTEAQLGGLEKATKTALNNVRDFISGREESENAE